MKCGHALGQLVKAPTRESATLDLIYTNSAQYFGTPSVLPSIGLPDHLVVILEPEVPAGCVSLTTERVSIRWVTARSKLDFEAALNPRLVEAHLLAGNV